MTPEAHSILLECFRRQPGVEPSAVAYGAGAWFGPMAEHQRQRYRRAIATLARDGLLVAISKHGRRLSGLQLTDAGVVKAYALRSSDTAASAASPTASVGTSPASQPTDGDLS